MPIDIVWILRRICGNELSKFAIFEFGGAKQEILCDTFFGRTVCDGSCAKDGFFDMAAGEFKCIGEEFEIDIVCAGYGFGEKLVPEDEARFFVG